MDRIKKRGEEKSSGVDKKGGFSPPNPPDKI